LLNETAEVIGMLGQRRRENLQRNVAIKLLVMRAVNLSHAAGAQGSDDGIRSHPRPDFEYQSCAASLALRQKEAGGRESTRLPASGFRGDIAGDRQKRFGGRRLPDDLADVEPFDERGVDIACT